MKRATDAAFNTEHNGGTSLCSSEPTFCWQTASAVLDTLTAN
jgi:hypothetical protein